MLNLAIGLVVGFIAGKNYSFTKKVWLKIKSFFSKK